IVVSAMGTTLAQPATSAGPTERESLATFLQMAADALGIASRQEQGVLRLEYDPQAHPKWPRPYHIDVPVAPPALGRSQRGDSSPREAWSWLWQRARLSHTLLLARPGRQPEAVHELTDRLFAPYKIEEGQVRLAGCHLVDVPFLRVTRLSADDPAQVEHQLTHLDGTPVSDSLRHELGLQQLLPHKGPSPLGG